MLHRNPVQNVTCSTVANFFAGIGAEEVQPFSMSLEAEMMLEQLKEQHLQEVEDLRNQLESKVSLVSGRRELRKLWHLSHCFFFLLWSVLLAVF